jgi:hypothetical protein
VQATRPHLGRCGWSAQSQFIINKVGMSQVTENFLFGMLLLLRLGSAPTSTRLANDDPPITPESPAV